MSASHFWGRMRKRIKDVAYGDGSWSAACGFLLARGMRGALISGRWDMPALLGSGRGALCAAALFVFGCTAVCAIHAGYSKKIREITDVAVFALYALSCVCREGMPDNLAKAIFVSVADGVAMFFAVVNGKNSGRRMIALLAVLPLRVCPILMSWTTAAGKLSAVSGGLAAAGLCGTAFARLSDRSRNVSWCGLIIGVAAGTL